MLVRGRTTCTHWSRPCASPAAGCARTESSRRTGNCSCARAPTAGCRARAYAAPRCRGCGYGCCQQQRRALSHPAWRLFREQGVSEQSASTCVSMLRAAGRPGSCRRSSFPVGRTALTRRTWWTHLSGRGLRTVADISADLCQNQDVIQVSRCLVSRTRLAKISNNRQISFPTDPLVLLLDEDPAL